MAMFMYRGPPILTPTWQSVPPLTVLQSGTVSVAQYLNNSSAVTITSYVASGTALPSGVTLNSGTGILSATAGATVGTVNGIIVTANFSGGSAVSGSISLTVTATVSVSWQTIPSLFIVQGGSLSLTQYLNNPGSIPILSYAVAAGVLPTGVTLNTATGLIAASAGATLGTDSGLSFSATY